MPAPASRDEIESMRKGLRRGDVAKRGPRNPAKIAQDGEWITCRNGRRTSRAAGVSRLIQHESAGSCRPLAVRLLTALEMRRRKAYHQEYGTLCGPNPDVRNATSCSTCCAASAKRPWRSAAASTAPSWPRRPSWPSAPTPSPSPPTAPACRAPKSRTPGGWRGRSAFVISSSPPPSSPTRITSATTAPAAITARASCIARIETLLPGLGMDVICSGANLDDQGDYRPGLKAAAEHGVRHPLQEAGFTKADVRAPGAGVGPADLGQAGVAVPVEPAGPRRAGDAGTHRPRRGGRGIPARPGPARVPGAAARRRIGPRRSARRRSWCDSPRRRCATVWCGG